MGVLKGDFIGFTIGNFHSSQLGLLRVSDGDRYEETLSPSFEDQTAEVPGGDGTYYWGTYFRNRTFNISVAFDSVTDKQFLHIKQLMNEKRLMRLIFDEMPFKQYLVKPGQDSSLKYICFDEDGRRVYKGEGTLSFISYYPFATNRKYTKNGRSYPMHYLSQFKEQNLREWTDFMPNINEWGEASRMQQDSKLNQDFSLDDFSLKIIKWGKNNNYQEKLGAFVSNRGDMPTDFKLYMKPRKDGTFPLAQIKLVMSENLFNDNDNTSSQTFSNKLRKILFDNFIEKKILNFNTSDPSLKLTEDELKSTEFICIDSKSNMIYGCDENKEYNGFIFNRVVRNGDFFKIPEDSNSYYELLYNGKEANQQLGAPYILVLTGPERQATAEGEPGSPELLKNDFEIEYDYLYY